MILLRFGTPEMMQRDYSLHSQTPAHKQRGIILNSIKIMTKSRIGKTYTSKTIQKILRKYIAEDQKKIEKRTQIATRINIALEAKGLTHKDLATRIGKRPSEIKRLLNAKQDFTQDILARIQTELGIIF